MREVAKIYFTTVFIHASMLGAGCRDGIISNMRFNQHEQHSTVRSETVLSQAAFSFVQINKTNRPNWLSDQ